jgi:hypothetical protein
MECRVTVDIFAAFELWTPYGKRALRSYRTQQLRFLSGPAGNARLQSNIIREFISL